MKSILKFVGALLSIIVMTNCNTKNYTQTSNGVIVNVKDSLKTKVRLQVISSNIIRVSATIDTSFSQKESLIVLLQKPYTDWNLQEQDSIICLSTPSISAFVNLNTGKVNFVDDKSLLLQETSKSIERVTEFPWLNHKNQRKHKHCVATDTTDSYFRISQMFESTDDEAFYGLGGHQHGYMNYKGKDVELAQHNMVPCIPFVYSNKNYGILWDNYSITRFGDNREYQQIDDLMLQSKSGRRGGLSVSYYLGDSLVKQTISNKIDYAFLATDGTRSNITDRTVREVITAPNGRIVWEGKISSKYAGLHKFLLYGSSYFKLWIDDTLVMDKWRQNWNPWSNPFSIEMTENEKHKFRLEWNTNSGFLGVTHLSPNPNQQKLTLSSEAADEIDYYFIHGSNADEVISGYRRLTGKATIAPKWAMGFWQSRQRYQTENEILSTVKKFREKHIPLDNIVLDWHYWQTNQWGSHEFDPIRFAHPEKMVDSLHNAFNAHIMISVWPKFYTQTNHYKQMAEKGFMLTHNVDMQRLDWVAQGFKNGFYDVYNPAARQMFWDFMSENLYSKGFDAWWLDATEPDMHSNISVADRKVDLTPNYLGNGERMFNPYALMNAKGVYEGQRAENNDQRVFILTRSGFAGQQHYGAATWSGDIVARWSDLKDQISNGANFSLSGVPYWTMDIGGFSVEDRYNCKKMTAANLAEWRELQTRWYQFGAFCPLYRSHGEFPYREPFNVNNEKSEHYQSILMHSQLRYRLMPYIYSLAAMTYHNDYTIMRALVMDFGADTAVLNINDQYMFGTAFLVNPVSEYKATSRNVYLPKSAGWYDFFSGKFYQGGQTIDAPAPIQYSPLFVRAGSIIPTGVNMEYTNQFPDSVLTVYVFEGANGSFNLYSDEGTNYNYEKGKFTKIRFSYNDSDKVLAIGNCIGSYEGMPETQTINIVFVAKENELQEFDLIHNPTITKTVTYTGEELLITLL